jgi:hypothetical protein
LVVSQRLGFIANHRRHSGFHRLAVDANSAIDEHAASQLKRVLLESHLTRDAAEKSPPPDSLLQKVSPQLFAGNDMRLSDERHLDSFSADNSPGCG